jgi:magnesium-transporting ATPase (P-type)
MTIRQLFSDGESIKVTGEGYDPRGRFIREGQPEVLNDDGQVILLLRAAALCSGASLTGSERKPSIFGDPTEGALVVAAAKVGL